MANPTYAPVLSTHYIDVSSTATNYFTPSSISAEPGEIVRFTFHTANESIIRAPYGYPCEPQESIFTSTTGFYSGQFPTAGQTWDLLINDTNPVFFYSGALHACSYEAAVGVINANFSVSLLQQEALTAVETYTYWPGQMIPADVKQILYLYAPLGVPAPDGANSSYTLPTSSSSGSDSSYSNGTTSWVVLYPGKLVAIILGCLALPFALAGRYFWRARHRRNMQEQQAQMMAQMEQGQAPPEMVDSAMPLLHAKGAEDVTVTTQEVTTTTDRNKSPTVTTTEAPQPPRS